MYDTTPFVRDDLLRRFHDACRDTPPLVGAEFERHLLDDASRPLPYFGEHGIQALFGRLQKEGWDPYHEGDVPIAASRGRASLTLEPGGQFELSGTPYRNLSDVHGESLRVGREIERVITDWGYRQVAVGYTPLASLKDIHWVPKGRYTIMREHLGETGPLAHAMMKGTAAVQASYDFSSEEDCAQKVMLASRLAPLTTALFANSPIREGKPSGYATYRGHIWTRTDPARTGLPGATEQFDFERWLDYLLDVPMMFVRDSTGWRPARGVPFRSWMEAPELFGRPPDLDDWELHMTSVFPEVRVKQLIEVRGADCVPLPLAMSFVALFTALFYDATAREAALELGASFASHGSAAERFDVACRDGLAGNIGGRRLSDWGETMVSVAREGMMRYQPSSLHFLDPLVRQVASGESPSSRLLEAWTLGARIEEALDWFGSDSTA